MGRIWFDDESFLAPFGHFEKDYTFVVEYLRNPKTFGGVFFDGFDESALLQLYVNYLKSGYGWIGFHKKKRAAYLFLELVSAHPLIYAVHGGLSRELFGRQYGKKSMEFVKQLVFDKNNATKLEGYILKPNNLIAGYFRRGGLVKECELKDRIYIDGNLSPISIYGLTQKDYLDKEQHHGWQSEKARSRRDGRNTNESARKRKKKAGSRKKRKRK